MSAASGQGREEAKPRDQAVPKSTCLQGCALSRNPVAKYRHKRNVVVGVAVHGSSYTPASSWRREVTRLAPERRQRPGRAEITAEPKCNVAPSNR